MDNTQYSNDQHEIFVGSGSSDPIKNGRFTKLLQKIRSLGRRGLIIIGVGVIVLVAGASASAFFVFRSPSEPLSVASEIKDGVLKIDTDGDGEPDTAIPDDPTPESNEGTGGTAQNGTQSGGGGGTSGGGSSGGGGGSSGGSSSSGSCALPKYPTAACTGVPAGWSPTTTIEGDLVVTTPGTVIENYLVKGIIDVRANNVTIRKTRVYGKIDNFITNTVYGPLLIEDTEVVLPPGQTVSDNYESAIGVANYTCRRCKVTGRAEAWRVGASSYQGAGQVTIEHSYAKLQVTQAQCDAVDPHGDGIQGYGGNFATIHHNTIDQRDDSCPTAPIFIPDQDNDGANVTDNVLAGGGYSLRLLGGSFPTVTGNKIVNSTWAFGPVDVDCNLIGTWNNNATITFDFGTGTILSQVGALNTC